MDLAGTCTEKPSTPRTPYPSDVTDEEWAVLAPLAEGPLIEALDRGGDGGADRLPPARGQDTKVVVDLGRNPDRDAHSGPPATHV